MSPTELIAHVVPRLLEEQGLRPRAPVGDEILLEGERADDAVWVMFTPQPRDPAGCERALASLAARFPPGDPPTRGLGLLIFLHREGPEPDLASLDQRPTPEGTQPILRTMTLDLADGKMTGVVSGVAPLASLARTIERAARAAAAGEKPPDFKEVVQGQVNLAKAYRARKPWATWALTAAIVAVFLLQRPLHQLVRWQADRFTLPHQPHLYITHAIYLPAPDVPTMMTLFLLLLTVMTLLALGALLERLFGWMSFLAMWFACAAGAVWVALRRTPDLIMPGAQLAVFGVMGSEVAIAVLRRSLPWPFRKGLLFTSLPFVIVNLVLVAMGSREVAVQIGAATVVGCALAAILPLRPPLSQRGGGVVVKGVLCLVIAACAAGLGFGVRDLFPKAQEAPRETVYGDPEGWEIVAPPGYKVHEAPGAGTVIEGPMLRVTIELREARTSETMARRKEEALDDWRRVGAWIDLDEEVPSEGLTWGHLRSHDEWGEADLWIAVARGKVIEVRAEGKKGSVRLYGGDVRRIVESFHFTN